MLLHIETTMAQATDLGYLLAKNPARCQTFSLAFGAAHVFYPVAEPDRCRATLLLDIDPVGLVRGRVGTRDGGPLSQYVNDRPYVASSFLSVAIAQVLGTALNGTNRDHAELAATAIPLRAELPVLPCRGGEAIARRLFEPLGYAVTAERLPLDEQFPEWGASPYCAVSLTAVCRLADLLTHLYVLLPVLDDDKHYWVGRDEQEKLLARGGDWLAAHPDRELIVERYLRHQRSLVNATLAQLLADDEADPDAADEQAAQAEEVIERPLSLNQQRLAAVVAMLGECRAASVVDLGCGEGRLLRLLLRDGGYQRLLGLDISQRALALAAEKLGLDRLSPAARARIELHQGSLTYRDARLAGFDAACAVEVIEHLDPHRLADFERVVFEYAHPRTVIVTTPNIEFNTRFGLNSRDTLRHRDHRFEWTRAEFDAWCDAVAQRYGYTVRWLPVGEVDPELGPATQMGVFQR